MGYETHHVVGVGVVLSELEMAVEERGAWKGQGMRIEQMRFAQTVPDTEA